MRPTLYRRFSTSLPAAQTEEFKVEADYKSSPKGSIEGKMVKSYQLLRRSSALVGTVGGGESKGGDGSSGWSPDLKARGLASNGKEDKLTTQTSLPTLPAPPKYFINIIGAEDRRKNPSQPMPVHTSPGKPSKVQSENTETQHTKVSKKHMLTTFEGLEEAGRLSSPSETLLSLYRLPLPPPRRPLTLIFDLEETLIHICAHSPGQFRLPHLSFNLRPHALQSLRELHTDWEIIVFASSPRDRVEALLDFLDPEKDLVDVRLYQENCLPVDHCYVKDLRVLMGRDLKKTVIVDDSVINFAFQLDNGIPIKPWCNSQKDTEMLSLTSFLHGLRREKDVRTRLHNTFDLQHFRADFSKAFKKRERKSSI